MPFLKNLNHDSRAVPKIKPEELKASILQYAIEGRLVEQRAEEGTAEELYKQIQSEKQKLIKEGKIKKEKPLPEISEGEIPFDIPESWKWVRLGDCTSYAQTKEKISPSEIAPNMWSLDLEDIQKETGTILVKMMASERIITGEKVKFHKNQVLYSKLRPYLKKILVAPYDGICTPELVPFNTYLIDEKYLVNVLKSPHIDYVINTVTYGVKMPRVGTDTMINLLIPLPPLAEQRRIVAKIEELLPFVDRYAEAYEKLEEFNAKFPDEMKKSILQYAIEGKLVEQRAEEGTAEELYKQIRAEKQKLIKEGKIKKEKPLPEITEDEIPFDIPESWKWVKFGQIMINRDAERIPLSVSEREKLEKIYDYYGASGVIDKVDNYLFDKKLLLIGEDGANLLSRSTPIAFLAEGKYWVNNHAHVLDCNRDLICIEYIMYFINAISLAPYVTGTAQPKMNQEKMNSIPVSLPPFEEQRRIVAKIEELLPLCERLAECREKA